MGSISSIFLPIAIAFIMFSLGLGLRISDFARIFSQPKSIIVGLTSQIIILPVIAFGLILVFPSLPAELAVGVMLIAAVPGGATSNMFTSLAKGDVALSISLTAITCLVCVITIPFIAINSYHYFIGDVKEISILSKSLELFSIVTIPTIIGMLINTYFTTFAKNFENSAKINEGCQIMAGAIIGSHVTIASNCIINCGSVVSHDSTIKKSSHITPGAILAGNVTIGRRCTIGMGSTVYLGLEIYDDNTINNGANIN